jgi:hypothetical protein
MDNHLDNNADETNEITNSEEFQHNTHKRKHKKQKAKKETSQASEELPVVNVNTSEEKEESHEEHHFEHPKEESNKHDSASNDSSIEGASSSTRKLFLENMQENAKVLKSQIGELQNDASDYVEGLISTVKKFEEMKKSLNSRYNILVRNLFNLLGYNYHTDVHKVNFFIFATQSWLLEVTKIVDKKYNEFIMTEKTFTFANLLNIMRDSEVSEENFLNNLGILTSSSFNENAFTSIVIENNVGKLFLNNLLGQLQHGSRDTVDIDFKKFEGILTTLLRNAVENVLNTMENQFNTEGVRNIPYTELYDEKMSYEEYFNAVRDSQKNLNSMSLYSLKICTESFYYFATCRLEDLLADINLFTKNYSSVLFKAKSLLGKRFSNYNNKVVYLLQSVLGLIDTTSEQLSNLRTSKLNEFYNFVGRIKSEIKENKNMEKLRDLGSNILTKAEHYKALPAEMYKNYVVPFIDNSYKGLQNFKENTKPLLNYPLSAYLVLKQRAEPLLSYYIVIRNHAEGVLQKPLAVAINFKNFIADQWELSKQDYQTLVTKVYEFANQKYGDLFVKLKPILYIEENGETKFRFSLNQKLMFINPQIFLDLYHYISNYIQATKEVVNQKIQMIKDQGIDKLLETKDYCLTRYRKFLGLCDDKEKVN